MDIRTKFYPETKRATIYVNWGRQGLGENIEQMDIDASGAIVAEERAFLKGMELAPPDSYIHLSTNSTHVPLRFPGIWQANTAETHQIISDAVKIAKQKNIEVDFDSFF